VTYIGRRRTGSGPLDPWEWKCSSDSEEIHCTIRDCCIVGKSIHGRGILQ
jgi:hypothetical protein